LLHHNPWNFQPRPHHANNPETRREQVTVDLRRLVNKAGAQPPFCLEL
jgi:hypothetical protein